MDTEKMRVDFERTNSRDHRRQPPKGNNYIDPMAQADWESFQKGWQASRAAIVIELPKINPVEWACTGDECMAMQQGISMAGRKIRAAGLTVKE